MKTGCQWCAIPKEFGSGQTCHRRFQEWERAGVFKKIYKRILKYYDVKNKIAWDWASMDNVMVKAPKGELNRENPTDRAKLGVKRHILTDGNGIPLAITLSEADVHDKHGVKDTLNSILIFSEKKRKKPKHLCLDKGYEFKDIEVLIKRRNIRSHIRKKGEKPLIGKYKGKPRRWVVERTTVGTIDSGPFSSVGRENRKIIWLLFTSRALLLFSISLIDSFGTGSKFFAATLKITLIYFNIQ
ncbi:transposase, IS4-like family protein [Leptospira weilii serovar Ranarum str. ICFT]|uniref:Transposase, IS4-like family protein n=1 Tax=Leptospira weilii serovar Ranarum str. ICFT TaxID=1218598 RepID=N1WDD4_9LEPT|nr:transposase, IS4-like family protein [Leptospira weilii serovar Ranarum str. ICFT]